ncbi:MAG: small basic protein [Candidatus Omnitrophica bacterium]|nr:small basic protein [Candidatus Omnitrophota bacterium]
MSLHSSLKIDKAGVQQRTVQTRIERIKELMKKGLWKEETPVTGLPKTKIIHIKVKKKIKAEGDAAAVPGSDSPADGSAVGGAAGAAKAAAVAAKPAGRPAALAKGGSASGGGAAKK